MKILSYIKLCVLYFIQDNIIFHPKVEGMQPIKTPEEYGFKDAKEKYLDTEDGEKILCWEKKPEIQGKPTLIIFHGNAGHFGDLVSLTDDNNDHGYRLKLLKNFANNGYGFIAVSHRGYAKSSGRPSEAGFRRDISAVAKYINENNINNFIIGESLGAFSALVLMQMLEDTPNKPLSVTLIAPFTNMLEKSCEVYPEFRKVNIRPFLKHNFDSKKIVMETNFKGRIRMLHPENDEVSAPYHSRILIEEGMKRNLDIRLDMIADATHVSWDPDDIAGRVIKELSN